jgi:hypothetical protein
MADILYGMNTHLPPPDHLDRLVAAGLRVARVDFNWAFIQPTPDRYEWAQTDRPHSSAFSGNVLSHSRLS